MKKLRVFVAGLLFISFLGCGSGKSDEEKAEDITESILEAITGEDVDIEIDKDGEKGSITIKGKDGEVTFSSNEKELPDNFPSDVYVVKGEIQGVGIISSDNGEVVTFEVKTDKNFSKVKEAIQKEMKSNGWKNTMTMGAGEESMQMYTKDEKSTTITVTKENDGTVVAYMVIYKK